eukprot:Nk52_evm14s239 gene=Nk52_evmTU14s239
MEAERGSLRKGKGTSKKKKTSLSNSEPLAPVVGNADSVPLLEDKDAQSVSSEDAGELDFRIPTDSFEPSSVKGGDAKEKLNGEPTETISESPKPSTSEKGPLYEAPLELEDKEPEYDIPVALEGKDEGDTDVHEDLVKMMDENSYLDDVNLFERSAHDINYERIQALKKELECMPIENYNEEFDTVAQEEILMVGKMSFEEVEEQERQMRLERIRVLEMEASVAKQNQQALAVAERRTRKELEEEQQRREAAIERKEKIRIEKDKLRQRALLRSFKKAEDHLFAALNRRKAEVRALYGSLMFSDSKYGGVHGRRYKLDWDKTPQPAQIRIDFLRAVKDKLPRGRYVLVCSLYDRIGGHVMRWSRLKGQEWGGATLPFSHSGEYHNVDLKINQSVFTVCPSKPAIKPGMVMVFELFILRGRAYPVDQVVGWGVFPMADAAFDIVQGKFKVPLLRGEIDDSIDKHSDLENVVSSDLDVWLCNLYFEVIRLPRYAGGQKEFEIELQFTSSLLGFPQRTDTDDVNAADLVVANDTYDPEGRLGEKSKEQQLEEDLMGSFNSKMIGGNRTVSAAILQSGGHRLGSSGTINSSTYSVNKSFQGSLEDGLKKRRSFMSQKSIVSPANPKLLDDGMYSEGNGVYYTLHKDHMNEALAKEKVHQSLLLGSAADVNQDSGKEEDVGLIPPEVLNQYHFDLEDITSQNKKRLASQKIQYIQRQIRSELGLSQWRTREFWLTVFLLVLAGWFRIYLHYIGQWLYLNAAALSIVTFDIFAYTVELRYPRDVVLTSQEFLLVMIGPLFVLLGFAMLISIAWLCERLIGSFVNLGSKFIMCFGLVTVIDWLLILIVDCGMERWKRQDAAYGDAFKLYQHFLRNEGNGFVGIFLTFFIYLFTTFLSLVLFYQYFLKLHMNGRMIDIYYRLHGGADDFFLPMDLELSNNELRFIIRKAEKWRGERGERKKVAVYDSFIDGEGMENQRGYMERTTLISVYILHADGFREMWRHFVRMNDGAIIEVFGEMDSLGISNQIGIKKNLREEFRSVMDKHDPSKNSSAIKTIDKVLQEDPYTNIHPSKTQRPPSAESNSSSASSLKRNNRIVPFDDDGVSLSSEKSLQESLGSRGRKSNKVSPL